MQSLTFHGSLCAYVDDTQWRQALLSLINLRQLAVAHHVPLEWETIPHIPFRLRSFTIDGTAGGAWAGFIYLQPELEELHLLGDFIGKAPGLEQLPALRHVTGGADDIAKFAACLPLRSAVFWKHIQRRRLQTRDMQRFVRSPARMTAIRITAGQLVNLFSMIPDLFKTATHLALDEELKWGETDSEVSPIPLLESRSYFCPAPPAASHRCFPCEQRTTSAAREPHLGRRR